MNERPLILAAWQQIRSSMNYIPRRQRVDEFFARVASQSDSSWEELARVARAEYRDVTPEILSVLLAANHPLITANTLRFAELDEPAEVEVVKRFVRQADPQTHEVILKALAGVRELKAELKAKKNLPKSVRAALKS